MSQSLKDLYDDLQLSAGAGGSGGALATSEAFILRLAQLVLSYGMQIHASDIHLEPTASGARVRYRVDGMLHEMLQLSPEIRDPLIRSIKVKANMANETVGRSKPQDGRVDFDSNGKAIDLRLSSFPTLHGDVLAIRILDRSSPLLPLDQQGFTPKTLEEFERLIRRPNGLILVTGPANSGKTTTLYGALNKLRSPHIKVVTLEDPVEYQVDGIDQAQINPANGVTFASGLRAILRQDANVILVGEIRDKETAEIAVRASLTGHLVFSTLHTRNSFGAATRLIDMDIEPYLIVASLSGVIAQRLVRVLCPKCKATAPEAAANFERLWKRETDVPPTDLANAQWSRPVGCAACNKTGYKGRTCISELLTLSEELKRLIIERDTPRLYRAAVNSGMITMMLDGLQKAAQGITTIEEILRVTGSAEDA
jgi:type IV pilus assembly protein PilB